MPDWEELMADTERAGWQQTGPSPLGARVRGTPSPSVKAGLDVE